MLRGDDKWIPKHNISTHAIFGWKFLAMINIFVVAIHPEFNSIFFTITYDKKLLSYNPDRRETRLRSLLNSPTDVWDLSLYLLHIPSWISIAW
jgi:hypothetical protein